MYIPEFACGVAATIVVELILIIAYGMYESWQDKKKKK